MQMQHITSAKVQTMIIDHCAMQEKKINDNEQIQTQNKTRNYNMIQTANIKNVQT